MPEMLISTSDAAGLLEDYMPDQMIMQSWSDCFMR